MTQQPPASPSQPPLPSSPSLSQPHPQPQPGSCPPPAAQCHTADGAAVPTISTHEHHVQQQQALPAVSGLPGIPPSLHPSTSQDPLQAAAATTAAESREASGVIDRVSGLTGDVSQHHLADASTMAAGAAPAMLTIQPSSQQQQGVSGSALAAFASQEGPEPAGQSSTQVPGSPVAAHIPQGRLTAEMAPVEQGSPVSLGPLQSNIGAVGQQGPVPAPAADAAVAGIPSGPAPSAAETGLPASPGEEEEPSIDALLRLIRSHSDMQAAVAAALTAVQKLKRSYPDSRSQRAAGTSKAKRRTAGAGRGAPSASPAAASAAAAEAANIAVAIAKSGLSGAAAWAPATSQGASGQAPLQPFSGNAGAPDSPPLLQVHGTTTAVPAPSRQTPPPSHHAVKRPAAGGTGSESPDKLHRAQRPRNDEGGGRGGLAAVAASSPSPSLSPSPPPLRAGGGFQLPAMPSFGGWDVKGGVGFEAQPAAEGNSRRAAGTSWRTRGGEGAGRVRRGLTSTSGSEGGTGTDTRGQPSAAGSEWEEEGEEGGQEAGHALAGGAVQKQHPLELDGRWLQTASTDVELASLKGDREEEEEGYDDGDSGDEEYGSRAVQGSGYDDDPTTANILVSGIVLDSDEERQPSPSGKAAGANRGYRQQVPVFKDVPAASLPPQPASSAGARPTASGGTGHIVPQPEVQGGSPVVLPGTVAGQHATSPALGGDPDPTEGEGISKAAGAAEARSAALWGEESPSARAPLLAAKVAELAVGSSRGARSPRAAPANRASRWEPVPPPTQEANGPASGVPDLDNSAPSLQVQVKTEADVPQQQPINGNKGQHDNSQSRAAPQPGSKQAQPPAQQLAEHQLKGQQQQQQQQQPVQTQQVHQVKPPGAQVTTTTAQQTANASGSDVSETSQHPVLDMHNYLEHFPTTRTLLEVVRATPNNSTKTPLSLLNEFAARLCLDVVFTEEADAQAGPFTVTAALQGRGGAAGYIHAKGTGKGRNKRDGRQVAAAALMEVLLTRHDDEGGIRAAPADFLAPSKPTGPSRREVMMKPGLGFGSSGSSRGGLGSGGGIRKRREEEGLGYAGRGGRWAPALGLPGHYRHGGAGMSSSAGAGGAAGGGRHWGTGSGVPGGGVAFTRAHDAASAPLAYSRDQPEILYPPPRSVASSEPGDQASTGLQGLSLKAYEPALAGALLGSSSMDASLLPGTNAGSGAHVNHAAGGSDNLMRSSNSSYPPSIAAAAAASVAAAAGLAAGQLTRLAMGSHREGSSALGAGTGAGGGGGGVFAMQSLQAGLPQTMDPSTHHHHTALQSHPHHQHQHQQQQHGYPSTAGGHAAQKRDYSAMHAGAHTSLPTDPWATPGLGSNPWSTAAPHYQDCHAPTPQGSFPAQPPLPLLASTVHDAHNQPPTAAHTPHPYQQHNAHQHAPGWGHYAAAPTSAAGDQVQAGQEQRPSTGYAEPGSTSHANVAGGATGWEHYYQQAHQQAVQQQYQGWSPWQ